MSEPWSRRKTESTKAYQAFLCYLNLSPRHRSVNRAYRIYTNVDINESHVVAPAMWSNWCSKYKWVERATAYDDIKAAEDIEKWEKRKQQARERDWEQAEQLRAIVAGALPSAEQFFTRRTQTIPGVPAVHAPDGTVIRQGVPAQTIITVAFNVTDLTRVLVEASKMQKLVNNEPTDNINNLTGAALDQALRKALKDLEKLQRDTGMDDLLDGDEEGDAEGSPDEDEEYSAEGEPDEGTED